MKTLFLPFRESWESEDQKKMIEYSASSRIRCDWVAKYMKNATVWKKDNLFHDPIPDSYDVYIFQKTFTPYFQQEAQRLKDMGKTLIFDLCDAEWERPDRKDALRNMLSLMDFVTTSTEYIREYIIKNYHKPARYIPDRMDLKFFPKIRHHTQDTARVCWFGNRNTIGILNTWNDMLYMANKKTPFTLVLMSDQFDAYKPPVGIDAPLVEQVEWTLEKSNEVILGCDVVVNPHDMSTDTGKAKSDNKTITAWALGMPVVSHGNPHRIESLISTYLSDADLRNKAGSIGRKMVEQLYDSRISALEIEGIIKEVYGN